MAVDLKLLEEELTSLTVEVGRARLRWGHAPGQTYDVYLASLGIGPYQVPGIRVLADARLGDAILGRDVLNQFVVTLNGPGATVNVGM